MQGSRQQGRRNDKTFGTLCVACFRVTNFYTRVKSDNPVNVKQEILPFLE
jgi:hypothetical protein